MGAELLLSDVVAEQVARRRRDLGLNRDQLSEKCTKLGLPLSASAIANLETGRRAPDGTRRRELTVDELCVLARALRFPPLLLLVPLGLRDSVEIGQGHPVSTTDAMMWLRGDRPLPGDTWDEGEDGSATIASFAIHQQLIDGIVELRRRARIENDSDEIFRLEEDADRRLTHLRSTRHLMRARGLGLPPVPTSLGLVDQPPRGDDEWDDLEEVDS